LHFGAERVETMAAHPTPDHEEMSYEKGDPMVDTTQGGITTPPTMVQNFSSMLP
jgi:hypothetical protein